MPELKRNAQGAVEYIDTPFEAAQKEKLKEHKEKNRKAVGKDRIKDFEERIERLEDIIETLLRR